MAARVAVPIRAPCEALSRSPARLTGLTNHPPRPAAKETPVNAADRLAFNVTHELTSQVNAGLGDLSADYDVPAVARSLYHRFGPGWCDLSEVPEPTYREILLRLSA